LRIFTGFWDFWHHQTLTTRRPSRKAPSGRRRSAVLSHQISDVVDLAAKPFRHFPCIQSSTSTVWPPAMETLA
jgi:hypothetical protein